MSVSISRQKHFLPCYKAHVKWTCPCAIIHYYSEPVSFWSVVTGVYPSVSRTCETCGHATKLLLEK